MIALQKASRLMPLAMGCHFVHAINKSRRISLVLLMGKLSG